MIPTATMATAMPAAIRPGLGPHLGPHLVPDFGQACGIGIEGVAGLDGVGLADFRARRGFGFFMRAKADRF
jgi:hypothetical protein